MQKRFLMTTVAVLLMSGAAFAVTANWTGDFSNDFNAALNWDSQTAPVGGDVLTAKPGSYYNPVYMGTGTTSSGSLYVDHDAVVVVNSGTLRLTSTGADGASIAIYNNSLTNDGVTVKSGATFRADKNLYVGGHGLGEGRLTIEEGGKVQCGTLTVGYGENSTHGLVNVFGGTLDMGTLLRIAPDSLKASYGKIDIRNGVTQPGVAFGSRGATVGYTGNTSVTETYVKNLINKGYIVSEPGYAPVAATLNSAGGVVAESDGNGVSTYITVQKVYYATNPTPAAVGGSLTCSSSQTLSWVKPYPRVTGDTVTSDVYFGTTNPPTTLVASNTAASSVTVTTFAEQTYYWKVDSRDSNGGSPIVTSTPWAVAADTWNFDTKITPTMEVGTNNSGKQAAFKASGSDPNAWATLAATATDDGYPTSPLTYVWEVAGGQDANVVFSPSVNVLNPTVRFNVLVAPNGSFTINGTTTNYTDGYYHFRVQASDGARSSAWVYLIVRAYDSPAANPTVYCDAIKWIGFTAMTGDLNSDCKVDYKDLVSLVNQWLTCNSMDCL